MLSKSYQRVSDWLLIFGFLFLANFSAFLSIIWLDYRIVFALTLSWLLLGGLALWLLRKYALYPAFWDTLKRNWFILPFLVFAGLSIFWSVNWLISLCRWITFVFTIVAGAYVGLRYNVAKTAGLLSGFGLYILALSYLVIVTFPEAGVMNYYSIQGAWKGIYWHKNHMGLIASLVNLLFLLNLADSLRSKSASKWFWVLAYVFALAAVYFSDSAAALMTTIALHGVFFMGLVWLKFKARITRRSYAAFGAFAFAAALLTYFNLEFVFGLFNRNVSMTGRIPMWGHLFGVYFSKRPVFGYGFNAFWYIEAARENLHVLAHYPDQIVIADNGFIDILMNTGYVGLALFLLLYVGLWLRSLQYAARAENLDGLFPALLMSYSLLANISWSLLFENEGFLLLAMLAVAFSITSGFSAQEKAARRPEP